jgi:hypothetical protein
MAGVLSDNGVHMGNASTYHPPPMKENPKGFFENREFRAVNDQLLRENGYHVKSFDPNVPDWAKMKASDTITRQMEKLVLEYSTKPGYDHWGFKDPRTCLTLRFWLWVIEELNIKYRVILMYRNNLDISMSMGARGNKGGLGRLAVLAGNYYKSANRQYHDFIQVQFNDLVYHTDVTLEAVEHALGIPLPNRTHIDPTIADRVSKQSPVTEAINANRR